MNSKTYVLLGIWHDLLASTESRGSACENNLRTRESLGHEVQSCGAVG